MKITLKQLRSQPTIDLLVIHSLQNSLYQAAVTLGDHSYRVVEDNGRPLTRRDKTVLLEQFKDCRIMKTRLRQSSAYDEMVAQPVRDSDNTLEVPLGGQPLEPS